MAHIAAIKSIRTEPPSIDQGRATSGVAICFTRMVNPAFVLAFMIAQSVPAQAISAESHIHGRGGGGGSGGALALALALAPRNSKGMKGQPPDVFTRDRIKSETFLEEFTIYQLINQNNLVMKTPLERMALMLTYITRKDVQD